MSKYTFSSLLAEAWTKTMIPSTLAAGFRKCGVYPFNLEAPRLSRRQKVTTEKEQQHSLCQLTTTTERSGKSEKEQKHSQTPIASCIPLATAMPSTSPTDISECTVAPFTAEEASFEWRSEEGFDLYNPQIHGMVVM